MRFSGPCFAHNLPASECRSKRSPCTLPASPHTGSASRTGLDPKPLPTPSTRLRSSRSHAMHCCQPSTLTSLNFTVICYSWCGFCFLPLSPSGSLRLTVHTPLIVLISAAGTLCVHVRSTIVPLLLRQPSDRPSLPAWRRALPRQPKKTVCVSVGWRASHSLFNGKPDRTV